ncbi:flagellar basal body P-ring formation chaperone FlgA [Pseudoalteromonas piscicida]|uniref:flagellar basal body P-ring formation chaperone FlgA n=1 Tax=Pseudoalteromonas piscicida TaxID=43662 RepID=UPI003C7E4513
MGADDHLAIEINQAKYLGQGPVTVADIADVSGQNSEMVEQAKSLPLKWPDNTNWLFKKDINTQIKSQFKLSHSWHVTGLNQVFLKRCRHISADKIEQVAIDGLNNKLDESYQRVLSASFEDDVQNLCRTNQVNSLSLKRLSIGTLFSKSRVTFVSDGAEEFTVIMKLALQQKVPVLTNEHAQNIEILASNVDWQWLTVDHLKPNAPPFEIDKLVAKKHLKTGQVLDKHNTKRIPLVEQGELISFSMRTGALFIKGKAKALGEGQLGDEINIMLDSSNKAIKAKIVQKGVVVVSQ